MSETVVTPIRPVDRIVAAVAQLPPVELPLTHRFTPGLYIREIFMPKGAFVVSRKHLTEHPFVVSKGHAEVWGESGESVHLRAPYTGITKPGTRRYLYIHEDCVWTTFHPADETDPDAIVTRITEPEDFSHALPEHLISRLGIWKEKKTLCP